MNKWHRELKCDSCGFGIKGPYTVETEAEAQEHELRYLDHWVMWVDVEDGEDDASDV